MSRDPRDYAGEVYLYGVVPAETAAPADLQGIQSQPVEVLEHESVAVLVSEVDPDQILGTPDDLLAHTQLLDAVARQTPVLPLAFGTVVPEAAAVVEDILSPSQQEYAAGLENVDGHAQYTVSVTFDRDTVLREIITELPEAAHLREQIAGTTEDQTRPQRIQLGELMVRGLEQRQPAAAAPVIDRLQEVTSDLTEHERRQPDDVIELAALVAHQQAEEFEEVVEDLAREFHPRCKFRLVGPQAPYDFVPKV
ncbi:GvpL/GvpF family gas vesicle protein [Nesterenkonia sphaerica]|uniref:GvpL/GvpF family gas vesicle protein n=1 Tax=Nesterenkonia sphaerica TaxID=1804988 RepID=A0A5R9AA87_9MICC|nr:GvpL/GvpF family gas vesicle protein [Nesterenkonia sphaerica]TLP75551.1 GvpL/GvpF family gas vesicle protein [Nesterenkonia sphaerica]